MRDMVAGFPFFATLVHSVERALGIADMVVFERYVRELVSDPALRERFLPRIVAEYERSVAALDAIRLSINGVAGLTRYGLIVAASTDIRVRLLTMRFTAVRPHRCSLKKDDLQRSKSSFIVINERSSQCV